VAALRQADCSASTPRPHARSGRGRPRRRQTATRRSDRPAAVLAFDSGEEGRRAAENGEESLAPGPSIDAVDGTAAGDAFHGPASSSRSSRGDREGALRRPAPAGALAASRFGAQPSLPTAAEMTAILAR